MGLSSIAGVLCGVSYLGNGSVDRNWNSIILIVWKRGAGIHLRGGTKIILWRGSININRRSELNMEGRVGTYSVGIKGKYK